MTNEQNCQQQDFKEASNLTEIKHNLNLARETKIGRHKAPHNTIKESWLKGLAIVLH